jgi:PAS domain-containing protein
MIRGLFESTWGEGAVIDKATLGTLVDGLRAAVTITDQDFLISFMNDRAAAFYAEDGGVELIGRNLLDCHRDDHKTVIRAAYDRYRAGDLTPTRYHAQKEGGAPESIVHIPMMVDGQFRGIAELIWNERADLVFDL